MSRTEMARRRTAAAYDALLGRPVPVIRPTFGTLVVIPMLAAAAGALLASGLESMMARRRRAAAIETAVEDTEPEAVSVR